MIILMRKYVAAGGIYKGLLLTMALALVGAGILPGIIYMMGIGQAETPLRVNGLAVDGPEFAFVQRMYQSLYEQYREVFKENFQEVMSMQGLSGNEELDTTRALLKELLLASYADRMGFYPSRELNAVAAQDPVWMSHVIGRPAPTGILNAQGAVILSRLDDFLRHTGIPYAIIQKRSNRFTQSRMAIDLIRLATPLLHSDVQEGHIRLQCSREYTVREYPEKVQNSIFNQKGVLNPDLKPNTQKKYTLDPRDRESLIKLQDKLPVDKMLTLTKKGQKAVSMGSGGTIIVVTLDRVLAQAPETAGDRATNTESGRMALADQEAILSGSVLEALRTHATIKR